MNRVLIRAGYGVAPVFLLGVVALISGGGRHRVLVLAIGVLLGVVLAVTAKDGAGAAARRDEAARPAPERAQAEPVPVPVAVPAQATAGERD
jgi:hypothetical protein